MYELCRSTEPIVYYTAHVARGDSSPYQPSLQGKIPRLASKRWLKNAGSWFAAYRVFHTKSDSRVQKAALPKCRPVAHSRK